jgi:hypothetical protein
MAYIQFLSRSFSPHYSSQAISRANSLSSRRSTGPLSSGVPRGDGVRRGARLVGRRTLYSCLSSFLLPAMAVRASSRVTFLQRFSGGGGTVSGGRRSLLLLRVGVGLFFGAGRVRYGSFAGVSASATPECGCLGQCWSGRGRVWCCSSALAGESCSGFIVCCFFDLVRRCSGRRRAPALCAFGKDFFPHLWGSFAVVVAVASGLSSSTWSTTAASDCFFPWQHRSDNGRRAFRVLSTAWKVHAVECCGVSEFKVWRCSSALPSGFLTGFVVRCSSSMSRSCGRRRSSPVKSREPGWGSFVISLISRVFVVKRLCTVHYAI